MVVSQQQLAKYLEPQWWTTAALPVFKQLQRDLPDTVHRRTWHQLLLQLLSEAQELLYSVAHILDLRAWVAAGQFRLSAAAAGMG
jgi:hypothetical protein